MDLSYGLFFSPSVEYLSSLRPYNLPKKTAYVFLYAIDPVELTEAEQRFNKFMSDKVAKPDIKVKIIGQIKESDEVNTYIQGPYRIQGERYSADSDETYEDASEESGQNMMEMTLSD